MNRAAIRWCLPLLSMALAAVLMPPSMHAQTPLDVTAVASRTQAALLALNRYLEDLELQKPRALGDVAALPARPAGSGTVRGESDGGRLCGRRRLRTNDGHGMAPQ